MNNASLKARTTLNGIVFLRGSLIALWMVFSFQYPSFSHAQVTTPPPTPSISIASLFEGDSCSPPCWFGLTPGESTLDDVVEMFGTYPNMFFNQLVEVGRTDDDLPIVYTEVDLQTLHDEHWLEFYWISSTSTVPLQGINFVDIEDNVVSQMRIAINRDVALNQTLERLGSPDVIRTYNFWSEVYLLLFYREQNMIVQLLADRDTCNISSLSENFRVYEIYYLSEQVYRQQAQEWLSQSTRIPNRLWENWLAGEVNGSCATIIGELHE